MIRLILTLLMIAIAQSDKTYVNSVWSYEVTKGCVNTLKLKAKGKAESYESELDYTFHDTYKINKDTLFLTEPDDAHSEDGGKVTYYRYKYLIRNQALFCIGSSELIKGRWVDKKVKFQNAPVWKRIK